MKRVLFQGAFDLINYGHIRAIQDAKGQGDYLIIALNSDELIRCYKHREPILPYWQRRAILEAIKGVDEVVIADNASNPLSALEMLIKYDIDVYVVADEWSGTKMKEIAYMKSRGGSVFFTPEYEGVIRSTEIRRRCAEEYNKTRGTTP